MTKDSANLFFQLVSKRYERGSIILNTNRPFEEWGSLFKDNIVATAILDRLLHHSYVFYFTGKSYRLKRHDSKNVGKDNYEKRVNFQREFSPSSHYFFRR